MRDLRHLQKLLARCTFTPVLGSPQHLKLSATSTSTRPHNVFSVNTFNLSHGAQTQQRRFATKTISPKPASTSSSAETTIENTQPWTKDDDRMLATLRRKKTNLAQIQIYMPHQPIAAIEAHIKQLDERTNQKPTFQRWTPQEDELLTKAVEDLGTSNWNEISDLYFSPPTAHTSSTTKTSTHRRSPRSCQIRWNFLHAGSASGASSSAYRTGAWTADELELFQELVNPSPTLESPNDWEEISLAMGTRSPIQCHSQFKTVMHTGTKGKWTVEEVNRLLEARDLYGGDWQKVAKHVGTRAPGQVRQKWNQFSEDVLRRLQARRQRVTE
ncbi:Myblike DNAbinding domain-containing protein [Mortierella sp. AD094]|nr:Myblike DNAbinding domain-containing protein [Mortierella sp. AD094]